MASRPANDSSRAKSRNKAAQVADAVYSVEVPDTAVGLLIVDGEFTQVLEPGLHAFWKYQRAVKTELVERRVQAMEVAGQEILTRDKVTQLPTASAHSTAQNPEWGRL